MANESVLIVEDEDGIRSLLQLFLKNKGYKVHEAKNGLIALAMLNEKKPEVILLDIEMPEMDGFEVCKKIREQSKVPILFISCRKESMDKMTGFKVGGDDYITKPFDFHELDARIQALLRRNDWISNSEGDTEKITKKTMTIYTDRCEVYINDNKVHLLHKEYQLLLVLVKHPNRVWTAEQLYDHIWGYNSDGTPQTVKVHISNLRGKLYKHSKDTEYIQTIRGFGYRFLETN